MVSHWSKAIYAAEEYFINEAYLIPPPGKKYAMRYMQPQGRDEKGTVKTPHVFLVWHTRNGNIMVEEDKDVRRVR